MLANTPMLAPAYFIVAGTKSGEVYIRTVYTYTCTCIYATVAYTCIYMYMYMYATYNVFICYAHETRGVFYYSRM